MTYDGHCCFLQAGVKLLLNNYLMAKFCSILIILFGFISCYNEVGDEAVLASLPVTSDSSSPKEDFLLFSSPGSHKLNIVFRAKEKSTANLRIFYEDGKLVRQQQLQVNPGMNTWEYQLPVYHKGMTIVQFSTGKISKEIKVVM